MSPPAVAARVGLVRDAKGAAAVEFALLLPLLLLLLAGLTDVSRAILTSLRLQAAAQAGVDYAASHGWSAAAVASAAAQATPLTISVIPTLASACDSPTGPEPPAGPGCADGDAPGDYVSVVARTDFRSLMPWPGLPRPAALSARALARIR